MNKSGAFAGRGDVVGAGASRGAVMRGALLATTALVGVTLASPAAGQATLATPAQGGTITAPSAAGTTVNNQTTADPATSGGLTLTLPDAARPTQINGVTITNSTGAPSADALRLVNSGAVTVAARFNGVNTLTTTQSGGAAFSLTAGANSFNYFNAAGSTFTGSYGIKIATPAGGGGTLDARGDTGQGSFNQTFTGNGTAVAGVSVTAGLGFTVYLAGSTIQNFATGISVTSASSLVDMTGGSITASNTGILAASTGGASTVTSQAAIVAPTGISATATNGATITTSGGGTINAVTAGTGTGIIATSSAGTAAVDVTVGAAIGGTTAFATGVNVSMSGTATGALTVTTTAAITGTTAGIVLNRNSTAGTTNTVTIGADVTGGTGIDLFNAATTNVTVQQGATVTGNSSSTNGTQGFQSAGLFTNSGLATVTNSGTIRSTGGGIGNAGVYNGSGAATTNTATGVISGRTGIYDGSAVTTINAGTITGTGPAPGEAGVIKFGGTLTNTGTITGARTAVLNVANVFTVNNTGGTITGGNNAIELSDGFLRLTNTGTINTMGGTGGTGFAGVYLNVASTASDQRITNSGTISGGSNPTDGFGVNVADGILTLTNQSGGNITGGTGAIRLASNDAATLTLDAGSTVTGQILSSNTGARTVTLAGTLTGNYNVNSGTGVNTFTLAATGAMQGAAFGSANDIFNFQGGAIGGTVDAGTGSDTFNSSLGAGNSATLNQSNVTGFDIYNQQSGILTLTGSRSTGPGWNLQGGTLNFGVDANTTASLTTSGTGVTAAANTTLNVRAGSLLRGGGVASTDAVYATGAVTVTNAGDILGVPVGSTAVLDSNHGIYTLGRIDLTNQAGGRITGGNAGVRTTGGGVITNAGSITGNGAAAVEVGTTLNNGIITVTNNGGGSIRGTNTEAGVLVNTTAEVFNRSGASIIVDSAAGRGQGAIYARNTNGATALSVTNAGVVHAIAGAGVLNTGTGTITSGGVAYTTIVDNQAGGQIVGSTGGFRSSGNALITNAGTIGTGTITGGNFAAGGTGDAVLITGSGANSIDNTGTISGAIAGVAQAVGATGTFKVVNRNGGTITGATNDGITGRGVLTGVNAIGGTISSPTNSGIAVVGATTFTNGGTLTGGNSGQYGYGFQNSSASAIIFNNFGSSTGSQGGYVAFDNGAATINLFAGSTTGAIFGAAGNDTLTLYNGTGTANTGTSYIVATNALVTGLPTDATRVLVQNAGALNAAAFGTINLGAGANTLTLRGAGDGTAANGAAGTLAGGTISAAGGTLALVKQDTGIWVLTGGLGYAGGTSVEAGTLIVRNTTLPGTPISIASGARLEYNVTTPNTILGQNSNTSLTGAGVFAITGDTPTSGLAWRGNFQMSVGGQLRVESDRFIASSDNEAVWTNNQGDLFVGTTGLFATSEARARFDKLTGTGAVQIDGSGSLTLGVANVAGGTAQFDGVVQNQSTAGTATTGMLVKIGAGTQTLTGINTYTGGTTISGGTLALSGAGSIANSVRVINDANLSIAGLTNGGTTVNQLTGAGTVMLGGNTLTANNAAAGTISGVISGAGGFTKAGAGNLTLTAANTYTGVTTISGGTLTGSSTSIVGSSIVDSAALVYNQSASGTVNQAITGTGTIAVSGLATGNTLTFNGAIGSVATRIASFTVADASNVTLNGNVFLNSALTINGGTLGNNAVLTTFGNAEGVIANGGRVNNGTSANHQAQIIAGNTGINQNSAPSLVVDNFGYIKGQQFEGITKRGGGTLTLTNEASGVIYGQGANANTSWGVGSNGTMVATVIDVTNAGKIVGVGYGVYGTNASDRIVNSGTIAAGTFTVPTVGADFSTGTISNVGGVAGVMLSGGGTVMNSIAGSLITGAIGVQSSAALALTNYGTVTGTGGGGVNTNGAMSSITNYATIEGGTQGLVLNNGGTVFNYGTGSVLRANNAGNIGDASGIYSFGALSLTNEGAISTASTGAAYGVQVVGRATIGNTGSISAATAAGLYFNGAGSGITNSGTITGGTSTTVGYGIQAAAGAAGSIINQTGGRIAGTTAGILRATTGALSVTNTGVIAGTGSTSNGVNLTSGTGTITNDIGGIIAGQTNGILSSVAAVIINDGTIGAGTVSTGANPAFTLGSAGTGIRLAAGGSLTNSGSVRGVGSGLTSGSTAALAVMNLASGTINATNGNAINSASTNVSINNAGTISSPNAFSAIYLSGAAGSTIEVINSGTLSGYSGVTVATAAATVSNSGTITAGTTGIDVENGGTVTNSGTIGGGAYGVYAAGTNGLILSNTGSLSGTTAAIRGGNAADQVTLGAASSTTGLVSLGGGDDTLNYVIGATVTGTLDGGAGTDAFVVSGTGTGTLANAIVNFENLTKNGTGTLTLSSTAPSFATVAINAGLLNVSGGNAIADSAAVTVTGPGQLGLLGNETIGSLAGNGGVALGANALTVAGAATTTYSGVLSGVGGSLVKSGTGTLILSGANTYTGATEIRGGTLQFGANDVLSDATVLTIFNGGTLNLAGFSDVVGTFEIQAGGTLTGAGTLSANAANLNGGTIANPINAVTVNQLSNTTILSGAVAGNVITATNLNIIGGTLQLGASEQIADTTALTINPLGTFDIGAFDETVASVASAGTINGTGTLIAATYVLSGGTVNANLGAGLLSTTSGSTLLNGTSGAGTVQLTAGTLVLGAAERLANTAALTIAGGAALDLAGFDQTVASVVSAGTINGTGTLTAATYELQGGTVNANLGAGVLSTTDGSTLLNGTSAAATVQLTAGALVLGAADRLADNAALTIAGGATLDLATFDETVASVASAGTINGTGTLTAASYALSGGMVNANLGTGILSTTGGTTALNGTSAATGVQLNGGTLALGADQRLADNAFLLIGANGTLDLGTFAETVGNSSIAGTLNGTGTLAAGAYTLNGATLNANLGNVAAANGGFGSVIFQQSGTSTLNGTSAAVQVSINGGTLLLGAAERLSDTSALFVNSGGTLDLQAFNETVGSADIAGTLNGTGTLTAGSYQLDGGTLNANLGTGTLAVTPYNGRASVLNGTAGSNVVSIQGGTLQLGASERLANSAQVFIDANFFTPSALGTLDLQGFSETVGALTVRGGSTLAGTGTLTASNYTLQNATINANLGTGNLTQQSGTGTLNGTAAAETVNVLGGTLVLGASDRLADTAAVTIVTGATLDLGANRDTIGNVFIGGTLNGTGTLTASTLAGNGASYTLNAGTVNANLGTGILRVVQGASTLNGTSAATTVLVSSGSLALGANERLADTAALTILTGAALNLAAFNETVGTAVIGGSVNGTGTLTAASYSLTGGTVNANLGGGVLTQTSGASTLNGTSAAGTVNVSGGTLALGASNRLADNAALTIASGATLNLGAFTDTVGSAAIGGNLNGTGTLTAASYSLTGGTVNANLGSGVLTQASGASTLNGTAAAATVAVTGGTLTLGAAERLANAAALSISAGATLNLAAFNETVGTALIAGTLAGTGTLTAATYGLTGGTVNANLGGGTLTQTSGTSTLNGTSAAGIVNVAGGTIALGASNRLADNAALSITSGATLNLGAFTDTVGTAAIGGNLNGTGTLTAASYSLTGGVVNANLGGGTLTQASGSSTLTGTAAANTVTVAGGTLTLGAGERLADAATLAIGSGATLNLAAFNETVGIALIAGTLAGTGTLTAASYSLTGGTVNANLGGGTLTQASGTSTLNGTAASATVAVTGGTLTLGAAERLADTATLTIASGATFDVGAFDETVGSVAITGALNGTGTLSAANYLLSGGTVNANLGAGTLVQQAGNSTLNGTSAASNVLVNGGTLTLGASNRLADAANVAIASGATLNLAVNTDTVGIAQIAGTLGGTGTLTASQYQLTGATVNGNLGAGVLFQLGGTSTLTGTAAAAQVQLQAGALLLGASERLADTAMVTVNSGATLDLAGRTETIGTLFNGANGGGTIATGTGGRLVVGGTNADIGFSGTFSGTGDIDKVGTGTFTYLPVNGNSTARLNALGGTVMFAGTTGGAVRVAGGSLTGGGTIGGNLSLTSGTLSPGTTAQPIASFQAGTLTISGGNTVFDLAGSAGGFASDLIRVTGAATLTGGTVTARTTEAASAYRIAQFYTVLQAGSLTGTFANGQALTAVPNDASLQFRLRYDLVPNSVVVELRKQIDFAAGLPAGSSGNQRAVAGALNGSAFTASDSYANALNLIASGTPAQRAATFNSVSGEAITDITSSSIFAATGFADLLRGRMGANGHVRATGAGSDTAATASRNALEKVRAAAGADGTAALAGDDDGNGLGVWLAGYGSDGRIEGRNGTADLNQYYAGAAIGADARFGNVAIGLGLATNRVETRVAARTSRSEGTLHQGGGYVAFDDGMLFANVSGSYFEGDIASRRSVFVNGALFGAATGETETRGYTAGGSIGYRVAFGEGYRVTPQLSGGATGVTRDAFTEIGLGALSLTAARETRDLYQATGELKLSHRTETAGGWFEPFVGGGARRSWGDRDATSAMRFAGAPVGGGAFTIQGAELPRWVGLVTGGFDARVSDRVTLGLAAETTLANRQKEGRLNLNLRIGF